MRKFTAKVIPFSSVVGSGVMLMDEKGASVGQFALIGSSPRNKMTKEEQMALCETIERAINRGAYQEECPALNRAFHGGANPSDPDPETKSILLDPEALRDKPKRKGD